ncbi:MAG: transcription antitermination factor NusB [Bacilli bacterium]|nr:transcription antitermination factor NusB [Bacilli bacterium]
MASRNQSHELIMQSLYIALTYAAMKEEIDIPKIMEGVYKTPFNDIDKFSRGVVIKTLAHTNEIIPLFESKLKNWKWSRLPKITQAILLMSYAHYHYVEKVDKAVVINTAIRLAKKYLDQNDYKFINGVLDQVL